MAPELRLVKGCATGATGEEPNSPAPEENSGDSIELLRAVRKALRRSAEDCSDFADRLGELDEDKCALIHERMDERVSYEIEQMSVIPPRGMDCMVTADRTSDGARVIFKVSVLLEDYEGFELAATVMFRRDLRPAAL